MVLVQKQMHSTTNPNREPQKKPTQNVQIIYNKRRKNIQWGKNILFNGCCWEIGAAIWKRIKVDYFVTPFPGGTEVKNLPANARM